MQITDKAALRLRECSDEDITLAFRNSIIEFSKIKQIDMNRMKHQISVSMQIIKAFRSGKQYVVIEAPTGFGKSILAMFVTEIFRQLDKLKPDDDRSRSYLLTSTKSLQNQYDRDIKLFNAERTYVLLKGQGNYICKQTNESFSKRPCSHVSVKSLGDSKDYGKCSSTCDYVQKRLSAQRSSVAVFNYSYWLTSMNMVFENLGDFAPFAPRTLTIFDESHLVGDIVQNMFSTEFNIERFMKFTGTLYDMQAYIHASGTDLNTELDQFQQCSIKLTQLSETANFSGMYDSLTDLIKILSEVVRKYSVIARKLKKSDDDDSVETNAVSLTDDQKRFMTQHDSVASLYSELINLSKLYKVVGNDSIVLSANSRMNNLTNRYDDIIKFQCTDEVEMVKSKLLAYTQYGIFMSATIGNIDTYAKQMGMLPDEYEAIYVESDFLFEKSPIYHVTPSIRMNYKEKAFNMPIMLTYIQKILDKHPDECGIIHTGNYEFMKQLQGMGNKRFLFYTNADEKDAAISKLQYAKNSVICGPSLLEGIDLKDDLARFMIFMKVPYASLADKLTKRKMDKYKDWYAWSTMLQVMQGFGRPIRHKHDYATTYLLDGSFSTFFLRNQPPKHIDERISITDINNIGEDVTKKLDDMFANF